MRYMPVMATLLLLPTLATADFYVRCDGCSLSQSEASAIANFYGDGVHHVLDKDNHRVTSYHLTITTGGGSNPFEIGADITATLVPTPTAVSTGFNDAMTILAEAQQGTTIPAGTLPRSDNTGYIDSAADVVVSESNLSRVGGYLQSNLLALAQGVATEVLNKYLSDVVMQIRFSDGSSIQVTLRAVLLAGGGLRIELVRLEDASRTADGDMIPDSSDDFDGLQINVDPNSSFRDAFAELATFWNIPIVDSSGTRIGGGSGNGSQVVCVVDSKGYLCVKDAT